MNKRIRLDSRKCYTGELYLYIGEDRVGPFTPRLLLIDMAEIIAAVGRLFTSNKFQG